MLHAVELFFGGIGFLSTLVLVAAVGCAVVADVRDRRGQRETEERVAEMMDELLLAEALEVLRREGRVSA